MNIPKKDLTQHLENNTRKNVRKLTFSAGFTLIELLVVASIISLLSSFVLFSVNKATTRSRDVAHKSDLHQLQNSLENYYIEFNSYPSTNNEWWGKSNQGGNRDDYIINLVPTYISKLPIDPTSLLPGSDWNGYLYKSDGNDYKLMFYGVMDNYPTSEQSYYDPVRPTQSIAVCSQDYACNWI